MKRAARAARNAEICRRRAKGVPLKTLALEFELTAPRLSQICADVAVPRLRSQERAAIAAKRRAIVLDAAALAEIDAAKRNPGPPYKGQGSWPT